MGADAYLPNGNFSNDVLGGHNTSVSSFRWIKRPLKEKKISSQEKQNDDELNKSLTFCLNGKWKTGRCGRGLWENSSKQIAADSKQTKSWIC